MFEDYPDPNKVKKEEQAYQPQRGGVDGLVLVLAFLAFVVLAVFAATDNTPTPAASSGAPAAQVLITATPTAVVAPTVAPTVATIVEERLDAIPLYGAGQLITVRVPAHYILAVGISYLSGQTVVQQSVCDPVPYDGVCVFPRPAMVVSELPSFALMVRDAHGWHYLTANPSKDVLTVVWGHHNGIYRYHVEVQP
jgi:hypothetical protein